MSVPKILFRCAGIVLILLSTASHVHAEPELTLAEAEHLTLEQAPWLQHHRTNADAAAERSVYEGRLPDPQLTVGVINLPTDSFRLDREDMTMTMVGVRQAFPPGDTRKLKSLRAEKELTIEQARLEMEHRNLRRQVRQTWFELYFQQQSLRTLDESRNLAKKQLVASEGRYRAAQEPQQAILQSRQALARLNERAPMIQAQIVRLQAQLARWIGAAAYRPLPAELALLPRVAEVFDSTQHPEWLVAQSGWEQARLDVALARQEYKPGVMLDLSYGFRRATPNGAGRPDMLSAMVTLDLPVFREKRQDRRLAEKQIMQTGAQFEAEDKKRELEATNQWMRAELNALTAREKIFTEDLLPAIRRESRVTTAGFSRDQSGYREVLMKTLDTELEYLRLRVDRARTQAELLYLTGEPQP